MLGKPLWGQVLRGSPGGSKQCEPGWWSFRYGTCLPPLWHSVGRAQEKKKKTQWLLPTLPSGRKLHPSSRPAAGHFSSSLYVCDACLQLLPPCWSSEGVSLSQLLINLLWGTARKSRGFCLLLPQSPLVFTTRSYGNYFSWHWNPGLGAWCGTGTFHSWGNLPDFYPPYMGVKPAHSTYPPLLPVKI